MNSDIPKNAITSYPKPPAEYRHYDQNSQSDKKNTLGDNGQQPQAPDLGGSPVQTRGDTGTAGTSNASLTASGVSNGNYPPYIIPRYEPILEVEVNLQIEAKNLQEAEELARKV